MKICVITVLLIVSTIINAAPADDFVITVKTNNPGSDTNQQYTIFKSFASGVGPYNYNVDCDNDGIDEATSQAGHYVCNYPTAGTYTIRIKDNTGFGDGFPSFQLTSGGNFVFEKILSVNQWGTGKWQSMAGSFLAATNLVINAIDVPNFSNVTSMDSMFSGARLANPDTSNWDISSVTSMNHMFSNATSANPDTSSWNTSAVTDMSYMFSGATSANPDTSSWDISNVTNMSSMFLGVTLPTLSYEEILIGFATQNLQSNIFFNGGSSRYCSTAAQAARASIIANFNWTIIDGGVCDPADDFVIRIKSDNPGGTPVKFVIETTGSAFNYNVDCDNDGIFESYAQSGNYTCDYSSSGAGIYTIRIQDNSGIGTGYTRPMFNSLISRHKILSIEQWGTFLWSNMNQAFSDCSALVINATDIPNFFNVSDFRLMFSGATQVNPNTSNWDMSSAIDIAGMFRNTNLATPNTSNWNTSQVTDMSFMFNGALAANPDVSKWDTSRVVNMTYMFAGAMSADPVISGWDVSSVTNMALMLNGLTLPTSEYDAVLTNFNIQNLKSNVDFDAGNSQYCSTAALAARTNMLNFNGWTISDGGQCLIEDIFSNGFELSVVVFKTVEAQFSFDFSDVELLPEDETPKLIAIGVDSDNQANVKIYLRQFDGILEIMLSQLVENLDGQQVWIDGLWHEVIEQGLSDIELW